MPPLIVQRNWYNPAISPDTMHLGADGVANVAVLGPLIWLHRPVPTEGVFPTNSPDVMLQANAWSDPALDADGD